jgi:hypothetical protein
MTGPAQPKNCSRRLVAPDVRRPQRLYRIGSELSWFGRAMAQAARVGNAAARGVIESLA